MSLTELVRTAETTLDVGDTASVKEARRTMEICNACRYCEGYCPVFPAMERRRIFSAGDLGHLANLCHNCKGCWHACQYAPPHEFALNVPKAFAELRVETYVQHAWPGALGRLFERNGLWACLATSIGLAVVMLVTAALNDWQNFTSAHVGEGAFYRIIPHNVMVALGGITFGWAILAMIMGARSYWRASGGGDILLADLLVASRHAATTRHLAGAGEGCNDVDESFGLGRKAWHMARCGALFSFAATSAGTIMHYAFGWEAPYSWYSAPVRHSARSGSN